jgi:hypothetical protein
MKPQHTTVSFRLTEQLVRTLSFRANRERRTVSQLGRLLLRDLLASVALSLS